MAARPVLRVIAGARSDGSVVEEEIVACHLHGDVFRVVHSPGLVLGVAADDEVCFANGRVDVVRRGGMLCVQIFSGVGALDEEMSARLVPLGARLDGRSPRQLVYTVAAKVRPDRGSGAT